MRNQPRDGDGIFASQIALEGRGGGGGGGRRQVDEEQ